MNTAAWAFHLPFTTLPLNTMFKEDLKGGATCLVFGHITTPWRHIHTAQINAIIGIL